MNHLLRQLGVLVLFGASVINGMTTPTASTTAMKTTTNALPLVSSSQCEEVSRREMFLSTASRTLAVSAAAMLLGIQNPASAAAASSGKLIDYKDETLGFTMKIPSDWEPSIQSLPDRRKISLYIKPDSTQKTLMFMAYTPVRDDFTSLGSFGSVDEVSFVVSFCLDEIKNFLNQPTVDSCQRMWGHIVVFGSLGVSPKQGFFF